MTTISDILVAAQAAGMYGDLDEADRLLAQAADRYPARAATWGMRALVAIEQELLDEAASHADRAAQLAPTDPQYANLAISIDLRRHLYGETIRRCESALRELPGNQRARCDLLIAAHALGDHRYDDLIDYGRIVLNERPVVASDQAAGSIHDAVADATVAGLRTRGRQPGTLVGGRRLADVFALPAAVAGPLRTMMVDAVDCYARATGTVAPPYRLVSWANLMRAGDYERPHIHETAWISGVYYARLPAGLPADDGAIRFGDHHYPGIPPLPRRTVRPKIGTLLLFPSYLPHTSLPFDAPGDRVSVAFDVLPTGP